jgi:hypothetical protein
VSNVPVNGADTPTPSSLTVAIRVHHIAPLKARMIWKGQLKSSLLLSPKLMV